MSKVAILIDTHNQSVQETTYQLLAAAQLGNSEIYGIVLDGCAESYQAQLQEYGVHKIIAVSTQDNALLEHNRVLQAQAVIAAMKHFDTENLIGSTNANGKDLLPRIAVALDAPLALDCNAINLEEQTVQKSQFLGSAYATIKLTGQHRIYGLRLGVLEPAKAPVESELIPFEVPLNDDGRLVVEQVIKKEKDETASVNLSKARVVISGGRALGNAENFQVLHNFAQQIGAAVGASRAAVDEGYAPHEMQIGQTGKTISPDLYIACGISGAVQHFAGMKTAKVIVAINTDPNAPVFKKCDYGIVADLFEALPIMTEIVKSFPSQEDS